jgi:hypothetical protein
VVRHAAADDSSTDDDGARVRRQWPWHRRTIAQCTDSVGRRRRRATVVATSSTITFAAGQMSRVVRIPLVTEPGAEPSKSFSVVLGNPGGGASLGARTTGEIRITGRRSRAAVLRWRAQPRSASRQGVGLSEGRLVAGPPGDEADVHDSLGGGGSRPGGTRRAGLVVPDRAQLHVVPVLANSLLALRTRTHRETPFRRAGSVEVVL